MNREDILRLAREAGIKNDCDGIWCNADQLERFAKLVVANIDPKSSMAWQEGYEAGVVAEREACAKVCEDDGILYAWRSFAEAIRARGKE